VAARSLGDGPPGSSTIRSLHDQLALRLCRRAGMSAILPEDAAVAQQLGFLYGHHIQSVPPEAPE
jgi:hypothetical protein